MTEYKKALECTSAIVDIIIRDLTNDEVEALLKKQGKIVFIPNKSKKKAATARNLGASFNAISILDSAMDRDTARNALAQVSSKTELLAVARKFKLHISKADRRDDLENKIIEFVIGAKLRSEAISTLNMKGGDG